LLQFEKHFLLGDYRTLFFAEPEFNEVLLPEMTSAGTHHRADRPVAATRLSSANYAAVSPEQHDPARLFACSSFAASAARFLNAASASSVTSTHL